MALCKSPCSICRQASGKWLANKWTACRKCTEVVQHQAATTDTQTRDWMSDRGPVRARDNPAAMLVTFPSHPYLKHHCISGTMTETPEEAQYWSLFESTQGHTYPEFVGRLRHQEGPLREEARAVLVTFQDGAKPLVEPSSRPLASSGALRNRLNSTRHGNPGVRRRIIVLEGLARNYIQVTGAKLQVPPDFFASHWIAPGYNGDLVNQPLRHYDNKYRFRLGFSRLHQARVEALPEDEKSPFYQMDSITRRIVSRTTIFGDEDGPVVSAEQVSFWSKLDGESWDAVLLVDAPLGKFIWWQDSRTPRKVTQIDRIDVAGPELSFLNQTGSWYPPILPGEKPLSALSAASTFKTLIELYPLRERPSTSDPNSCVDYVRILVLSAWTASIRAIESRLVKEQLALSIVDLSRAEVPTYERSWTRPWHPRDFARLVQAKSSLEALDWELRRNMDALGIGSSDSSRTPEAWEADAWQGLRVVIGNLKARLDIMLQAYMQSISVRETSDANKQARQVGYLTSLATIFIPLSLVAAVFSMGGDFAAGESRFWVYWAVAVPVAAVGCLLLFARAGIRAGRRIVKRVSEAEAPV